MPLNGPPAFVWKSVMETVSDDEAELELPQNLKQVTFDTCEIDFSDWETGVEGSTEESDGSGESEHAERVDHDECEEPKGYHEHSNGTDAWNKKVRFTKQIKIIGVSQEQEKVAQNEKTLHERCLERRQAKSEDWFSICENDPEFSEIAQLTKKFTEMNMCVCSGESVGDSSQYKKTKISSDAK